MSPRPDIETRAPSGPTDAILVRRSCSGDMAAFDELVRRHERRVVNLAYRLLGDRDGAHDAAQEAFISAFRSLKRFRGTSAFSTWLHRITYNVCMDELSHRRRTTEVSADTFYGDEADSALEVPDPGDTPDDCVRRAERQRAVQRALTRLPERQREVLVLFDLQGASYEEIAEALDCPVGTVKSRLNRARMALLEALGPDVELFAEDASRNFAASQ